MKRRNFIKNSFGLLVAAPMVVCAESIMRISPEPSPDFWNKSYVGACELLPNEIYEQYKNFLSAQSSEFQSEVLGAATDRIFREHGGNFDVSRFIGRRTSVLEDIRKTAKNIAIKSPCLPMGEKLEL